MSDKKQQFYPFLDEDASYALCLTSTANMRALDMLRLETPIVPDSNKREIARGYCLAVEEGPAGGIDAIEGVEYNTVPKDIFFERAAEILFMGADAKEKSVDFAEVRRAMGKFEMAGSEQIEGLASGLDSLNNFLALQNQKTNT